MTEQNLQHFRFEASFFCSESREHDANLLTSIPAMKTKDIAHYVGKASTVSRVHYLSHPPIDPPLTNAQVVGLLISKCKSMPHEATYSYKMKAEVP